MTDDKPSDTAANLEFCQKRLWQLDWAIQQALELLTEEGGAAEILADVLAASPLDLDFGMCSWECGENAVMACHDCKSEFCDECAIEHIHYTVSIPATLDTEESAGLARTACRDR